MSTPISQPQTEFSPEGRAFLDAFYNATKTPNDVEAKIGALRDHFVKEEMQVTSYSGDNDSQMELRALEYYYLIQSGIDE
jgi:hypothetical protein